MNTAIPEPSHDGNAPKATAGRQMTAGRRVLPTVAVGLGACALLGWAFVEWLILGPCIGDGQCTDRTWGGYYVPLQALFAAAGAAAATWLIASATGRRPLLRPFLLLACAAAMWTVVVTVR